ncbi:50S ribosomal protein L29 [candidate division WWE3 bacterium RIFCSPLOWO2_01_FULL_39_13]|uniref:Large ribosomal subunit protein uL29 n=1 Tax=candidate division WWE3 bacterium RIFCSPLOWO2_01_FULL_39_13 TaxID=1802624 RepID=A0A1F4V4T0_UNCKA|nr:MAG: 50S ribosomal protein L29 [candidate division WWE3 bacterium RIFCSPLOWO2_01_FULL_39_13]
MDKIDDLRKQNADKLRLELESSRKEFVESRFSVLSGKGKNTSILKKLKKNIARIKTVLNEKEVIDEQKTS